MRLLFLLLIGLLIATLFGMVAGSSDGYIVITISDYVISASIFFFAVVLFVVITLCCFLLLVILKIINIPADLRHWRRYRRQYYAERYLTQGLVSMKEGAWGQAERQFVHASKYSYLPHISYLLAARVAQRRQAFQRYQRYLQLACKNEPSTSISNDAAIELAPADKQLVAIDPQDKQQQHVSFLSRVRLRLRRWDSIFNLFAKTDRLTSYHSELQRQCAIYEGLLLDAGGQATHINKTWQAVPARLKKQPRLIKVYVNERLKIDQAADCEKLLRRALQRQWDPELISLYALITARDKRVQLHYMERLLKKHAGDPVLLLNLGRLSIRHQLWGKAEKYLEDSIKIDPSPEAYYELAALHEHNKDKAAALTYYQKGLTLAISTGTLSGEPK